MDLSIIILNYKSRGLLKECLRGIMWARPQLSLGIIVVDNASGDGTPEMVRREFPDVRLIESDRNRGYAGGNNLGIRAATGRYAMIMNPDIIVNEGSLEGLVAHLDAHPEIGLIAPKLTNPDRSLQYSCYRFPTLGIPFYRRTPIGRLPFARRAEAHYLMTDADRSAPLEVDWLLGGAVVARREALERVGLLDERFFLYFDDVDWSRRVWEAGWKVVYLPSVSMVHFHQRASAEARWWAIMGSKTGRIHLLSAAKYFSKYRGQPTPRLSTTTDYGLPTTARAVDRSL